MRPAVRSVFKQPLFSLIAIGTLALGIGLNVALFGIFNAMLFRPLPVQDPGRLVAILSSSTRADGPRGHLTYPDFEALRALRRLLRRIRPDRVILRCLSRQPGHTRGETSDIRSALMARVCVVAGFRTLSGQHLPRARGVKQVNRDRTRLQE